MADACLGRNFRCSQSAATVLPVFDPEVLLCGRRSWCGRWRRSSRAPQVKRRIEPCVWVVLIGGRITVGISKGVYERGYVAVPSTGRQHVWLECEIRLR